MKIKLDPGAIMPERAHKADAGLDLFSPIETWINPGCHAIIETGIHVQIPYGFVGLLTSKSGLMAKHMITSSGTIDSGYTNSIKAVLFNHGHEIFHVEVGMKITQLVIMPCLMPNLDIVDSFPETERGENGFGSTGYRAKSYFDLCHDPNRERRHYFPDQSNAYNFKCQFCGTSFIKSDRDISVWSDGTAKIYCPHCNKVDSYKLPLDQTLNDNSQTSCGCEDGCCQIDFDLIDKKLSEQKTSDQIVEELNGIVNNPDGLFGQMGLV